MSAPRPWTLPFPNKAPSCAEFPSHFCQRVGMCIVIWTTSNDSTARLMHELLRDQYIDFDLPSSHCLATPSVHLILDKAPAFDLREPAN